MLPRRMFAGLALVAYVLATSLAAQVPDSTIRLRARAFVPPAGLDTATLQLASSYPGRPLHVLVQFQNAEQAASRETLTRTLGVRWLWPLSDQASWAVVRADAVLLRSLAARTRWVGSLRPTDKLEPGPFSRSDRHPSDSAGWRPTLVHFFTDVRPGDQQSLLARFGARRVKRVNPINAWVTLLRPDSIRSLAREDAVYWLEPALQAPGFDNDKVRSASGINADPVLAPSPYALSGSGIVIGYWDGSIPSRHDDLAGRVVEVDPINVFGRNSAHLETGVPNAEYDLGETIYIDVDDSRTVTPEDRLYTSSGLTPPLAGDLGKPLALFIVDNEKYVDRNANRVYDFGEPIYRDVNGSEKVEAATDVLLTTNGGTDGENLTRFFDDLHAHSTMVVGSMLGNGARSLAESASSAFQWKGVAAAATARAYTVCDVSPCWDGAWLSDISNELENATTAGAFIQAHPWGSTAAYCILGLCYSSVSQMFDSFASNRNFAGVPFGFAHDVLAITSAGNFGYPERHTENVAANDKFEQDESIYRDRDGDGVVSAVDDLLHGSAQPLDTKLVDFRLDERHTFEGTDSTYVDGRGVYRDTNGNGKVDAGDERLTRVGGLAPGTVAPGDADAALASPTRPFMLWFTVRSGNSAKNTLQVGAISSNAIALHPWSGRGPTLDGRLKPDVVVAGAVNGSIGIRTPSPRNTYGEAAGTSMSVGVGAGAAALMAEWYRTACVAAGPSPATLRALMIHGAEDVILPAYSAQAGPDFSSGFGRLRVKDAVELVPHHLVGSVSTVASPKTVQVTIAHTQPLKVTLAWSDVPRAIADGATDAHGLLNNDLDLTLIAPDGTQYGPWITDASNPAAPATRATFASGAVFEPFARDRRNTVEQVVVDDAQPGTWKIIVSASQLNFGPQPYTIVSEALSPAVGPCAKTPSADVWVRDNTGDVGTVPSSGATWVSPDLWNRYAPDGQTAHQNPEYGQPNYLYVNVRNRTPVSVKATTVELWLADAALGLNWPSNFTYVGRIEVPNLGPNETRQVGPLEWNPPVPGASGHFCMYIRLSSPQDGLTIVEGSSVGTNAQTSNNIASLNLHIVDLQSEKTIAFLVRNTESDTADVDVEVRLPAGLLTDGRVYLTLSPDLAQRWIRRGARGTGFVTESSRLRTMTPEGMRGRDRLRLTTEQAVLPGFRLPPGHAGQMTVSFSSTRQTPASYDVDIVERIGGTVVGGIRYVVRTGRRP